MTILQVTETTNDGTLEETFFEVTFDSLEEMMSWVSEEYGLEEKEMNDKYFYIEDEESTVAFEVTG